MGNKYGMMLLLNILFAMLTFVGCASGTTPPDEEWNQTFGGTSSEEASSVQQTTDGGYILAGTSYSYICKGDFWLVKTDSDGNKVWDKTFGETDRDIAHSVQQTTDGGYILAGATMTTGIDIWSYAWLVKTDSDGNKVWDKTFQRIGSDADEAYSVQLTTDGGYIFAGGTLTYGVDYYNSDAWLVKTDSDGNKVWDNNFGGNSRDGACSVQQTIDGGYIFAGGTDSRGDRYDFWLVKTDLDGNKVWANNFGGNGMACSVQQTTDGGYALAGYTWSYGTGSDDFWLVKTNSDGKEMWNSTFGGTDEDMAYSVQQTIDGGYILAGYTESYGAGGSDAWLVKTDSDGNEQWNSTFGGTDADRTYSVQQTTDGGYILAGATNGDFWLIKVAAEESTPKKGDLNGDNEITSADAVIMLGMAIRGEYNPAADVSGDNRVTSLDALMILQAAAGAISL